MAYIRGQERLVYQSVFDYINTQLTTLGWFSSAPTIFGMDSPLVEILEYVPRESDPIEPNTVAITTGPNLKDEEGEMGCASGGLWITPYVFFVDVYAESQGIAKQLVSDIRAILSGRLAGTNSYQQLMDHTVSPAAPAVGHLLHFEDIETETPAADNKRNWRVVKFTCHHQYDATEGP